MYVADLKGSRLKIKRAEEGRNSLQDYIRTVFEDYGNRATLRADTDRDTGYHILSIQSVPDLTELQETVAVRTGEIVHNLRSALDHLAWQLANVYTGGNPAYPRRVQFPIEDDPDVFRRRCTPSVRDNGAWLGEVDPAHHAIIDRYQPYQGENGGLSQRWWTGYLHELALLRDLSDTDKHRVLTTILTPTTQFELQVRLPFVEGRGFDHDWRFEMNHTLEVGAQVMRTRLLPNPAYGIDEIEPHMDMVGYATPEIALEKVGPVVAEMNRIGLFVSGLLNTFQSAL